MLSSLLASGRAALEPSAVANSLGAAVGRASLVLKRRGRGGAAPEPPPPPVNVTVHRLFGTEMQVGVTAQTSLEELQQECERASGVPAALLRLCVQGEGRRLGAWMRQGQIGGSLLDWERLLMLCRS